MTTLLGPYALSATVETPFDVEWDNVAQPPLGIELENVSGLLLQVAVGGSQYWLAPWTARYFRVAANSVKVSVLPLGDLSPAAADPLRLLATLYQRGDTEPSLEPRSLSSLALEAGISGVVALANGSVVNLANGAQVGITGVPSVNVNNTPNVGITGTPAVSISGIPSVNVGTPTVTVGNSPTVALASGSNVGLTGTPSVAISGIPSVNVGTPTVTVGNSPTVALASGSNVGLTGTPSVAISGIPSVNIGSSGTVALAGGSNVGISGNVPIQNTPGGVLSTYSKSPPSIGTVNYGNTNTLTSISGAPSSGTSGNFTLASNYNSSLAAGNLALICISFQTTYNTNPTTYTLNPPAGRGWNVSGPVVVPAGGSGTIVVFLAWGILEGTWTSDTWNVTASGGGTFSSASSWTAEIAGFGSGGANGFSNPSLTGAISDPVTWTTNGLSDNNLLLSTPGIMVATIGYCVSPLPSVSVGKIYNYNYAEAGLWMASSQTGSVNLFTSGNPEMAMVTVYGETGLVIPQ